MSTAKETVHVWANKKECLLLRGKMIHVGQEVDLKILDEKRKKELLDNGSIKEELKSNIKTKLESSESKSYSKKSK